VATGLLLVDDHAGFRAMARSLLEAEGVSVLGEAADGRSAVLQALRLRPSLVLLDVFLEHDDGFEVCERLVGLPGSPAVILISSRSEAQIRRRLQASPAVGFIAKSRLSAAAIDRLLP
jgi:two-component system nitrate/nitrite response regulator NarL